MAKLDPVPQTLPFARSTKRAALADLPRKESRADVPSASKLKPQDLIAMLTQHYQRVRGRSRPKVATKLSCFTPGGKMAVRIRFG